MKAIRWALSAAFAGACATAAFGQTTSPAGRPPSSPPPSSSGFYPLSEVHAGLKATAWTVFTGTTPEPMDVEILGVLRGARGPGHDLILAQLHGAKPEYTGVVAGMSGSPVYVGDKLMGSLSFRIGQFSKDAIAGITPIEQMLEVRDLPSEGTGIREQGSGFRGQGSENRDLSERASAAAGTDSAGSGMTFQAMETPLTMSGFRPEAIRLWQQKMAGTGLETVAAGGGSGSSEQLPGSTTGKTAAAAKLVPGSAVSAQLVNGDLEIAATCTVTYIDPKQLLACGHPILQAGPVSLPMTSAEVVATLASPLNSFKIVNTGAQVGAFNEDRDSGIRGILGAQPRMIPLHMTLQRASGTRKLNVNVLDLPSLTPQAVLVSVYEALLESNESTAETSYHLTGRIAIDGYPPTPVDVWSPASDQAPGAMMAALQVATQFLHLYSNGARQGSIQGIDLTIEEIPRRLQVELETARLATSDIAHAGDTLMVEATVRGWQQPARNVRIPVKLPPWLATGNVRILVSDAATLDRTLDQPRLQSHSPDMQTLLAQMRAEHAANRIYVSLLVPVTQASVAGQALTGLPLSVANALEPLRTTQDVALNGESAELAADADAGGVLSGFQILTVHIDAGGGLN